MIVSCPSCSTRYKIDASKVQARGAKITCPKCRHQFVVRPEGTDAPGVPADLGRRDFREVGITWQVRKGVGLTYEFHDLDGLREALEEGQVDKRDALSSDGESWRPIETIDDLAIYFLDAWVEASQAQAANRSRPASRPAEDDEDDDDAPTQLVGKGEMKESLRRALAELEDDAPPAGAAATATAERSASPARTADKAPAAPKPAEPAKSGAPKSGAAASGGSGIGRIVGILVLLAVIGLAALFATGGFENLGPGAMEGPASAAPAAPVEPAADDAEPASADGAGSDDAADPTDGAAADGAKTEDADEPGAAAP